MGRVYEWFWQWTNSNVFNWLAFLTFWPSFRSISFIMWQKWRLQTLGLEIIGYGLLTLPIGDHWYQFEFIARGYIVLPGLPQQIHGSLITNSRFSLSPCFVRIIYWWKCYFFSLDLVEDPESGATLCRAINMCVAVSQNPGWVLVIVRHILLL